MRKNRSKLPPFVALGRRMLKESAWRTLSPSAMILYVYLKYKYVGHNNGDICLYYSEMKDMFSSSTLSRAFKELVTKEWVTREQIGGMYRYVNKYKLTGKYDETLFKCGF